MILVRAGDPHDGNYLRGVVLDGDDLSKRWQIRMQKLLASRREYVMFSWANFLH